MNFIGISGVAGSGKNTVADYIINDIRKNGYTISEFSFAGPLKDALCNWFGWDRQRLNTDFSYKESNTLDDGTPDPYCQALGMTRRVIMQKFGTECLRKGLHNDFWIMMADLGCKLGKIPPTDFSIISDARFINELSWIKSMNGFCIKIEGNNITSKASTHASEQNFLSWTDYDVKINNYIDPSLTNHENINNLSTTLEIYVLPEIYDKFKDKI